MDSANVVIIGGSAAGTEAARTAQKIYPDKRIVVVRKEKRALVPCGIPYIMGTLESIEKNVMPDTLLGSAELVRGEVAAVDRQAKTVRLVDGESIRYDKLVLATGSRPLVPSIPGVELENVFTVRKEMSYLEKLQRALQQAHEVVIIGGGFIGAEFADECHKMGAKVTIVELLDHCLYLNCDADYCVELEDRLREVGVRVNTGARVSAIGGKKHVAYVECVDGSRLDADLVILAIGVEPETELAAQAGLKIGESGGIVVDQYMITNDPDIYAIGDCAEKYCHFTGKPSPILLASVATREARIAAANLYYTRRRRNRGTIGVFSTVIAGTTIAVAGLTERAARDRGFEVAIGEAMAVDRHPGSMPDARNLKVKLIFAVGSGEILGGEACGGPAAGEMANVIAQSITAGMTATDIALAHIGTHPALTASPVVYQIVNAAEEAVGILEGRASRQEQA